jgi:hypothetical protein
VLSVDAADESATIKKLTDLGETSFTIGEIIENPGEPLVIME